MAVKALDLMDRRGTHMQTQLSDLQQVSEGGGESGTVRLEAAPYPIHRRC